jgi:translation initiation factor 2 subunit 2
MFFEKELQTSVSINQDGGLVITGMFKQPGLLKIFTNYIKEYVTCKECNSCDTEIIKENRITYLKCNKCLSKKAFN